MPVWPHEGTGLHGIDEPMRRKIVRRMKVGVFALTISVGGCLAGLIEQGAINVGGKRHKECTFK